MEGLEINNSQKFEDSLILATSMSENELMKSEELNAGFDSADNTWELIVKYVGEIDFLKNDGIDIYYLTGGYAILKVPKEKLELISSIPEIVYVEMPKSIFEDVINGRRVSCINQVQDEFSGIRFVNNGLFGRGVICAVIDSGIDFMHPVFMDDNGNTRILEIWDQTVDGGRIFYSDEINDAIKMENDSERYRFLPHRDLSGHGTHVAGIMAGNFANDKKDNLGIATRSPMIIVKLNTSTNNGFPRTTELIKAFDYVYRAAMKYNMPVSINLSFGNSFGSHDGTSLVETYIDYISTLWKMSISVGTGNEGSEAGHAGKIMESDSEALFEIGMGEFETSISIQIWKQFEDDIIFEIESPDSRDRITIDGFNEPVSYVLGNNKLFIYLGEPAPYNIFQEIFIEIIPAEGTDFISSGIWKIYANADRVVSGQVDMWLPSAGALNSNTFFLNPAPEVTLTIPSTAGNVISVGGYNSFNFSYADFSGRGYTRLTKIVKPELVAPAVNIVSAAVGGGYVEATGTSMATPFVSGSAALLMEWGIVNGADAYMYGDKLKAYLIRGARKLPGFEEYPNESVGYGALCLADSI